MRLSRLATLLVVLLAAFPMAATAQVFQSQSTLDSKRADRCPPVADVLAGYRTDAQALLTQARDHAGQATDTNLSASERGMLDVEFQFRLQSTYMLVSDAMTNECLDKRGKAVVFRTLQPASLGLIGTSIMSASLARAILPRLDNAISVVDRLLR